MSSSATATARLFFTSVLILGPVVLSPVRAEPPSGLEASEARTVRQMFAKTPLGFEPNQGQTDAAIQYLSRGPGYTLYLASTEIVLQTTDHSRSPLRIKFVGGSSAAIAEPLDLLPSISNYYLGSDPAKWHSKIPNYQRVALRNVYPGIDLIFYG